MDMAVANLLKHKIRFERYGGDYGNVNYVSCKIENLESIGARSLYDLCLNQLQSFFIHVFSTILQGCPHVISSIEIKAKVIQARGGIEEQDLIGFFIKNPRNNVQLFSRCSAVQFYAFDDDIFRADKPFYIIINTEIFTTKYIFPGFTPEIAL